MDKFSFCIWGASILHPTKMVKQKRRDLNQLTWCWTWITWRMWWFMSVTRKNMSRTLNLFPFDANVNSNLADAVRWIYAPQTLASQMTNHQWGKTVGSNTPISCLKMNYDSQNNQATKTTVNDQITRERKKIMRFGNLFLCPRQSSWKILQVERSSFGYDFNLLNLLLIPRFNLSLTCSMYLS